MARHDATPDDAARAVGLAVAAFGPLLVAGILVPFRMDHEPLATGLGIIAAYLAAALGLSFYVRRRIGTKRWRSLHRATILVYVLAVVHTLGAGSDAGTLWLRAQLVLTGAPVLFLFVMRVLPAAKVSAAGSAARPGSAPSPAPRSARSRPSRSA